MSKPDPGPFAIRVWKFDHWVYVGPHYLSRKSARSWVPFVQAGWNGMETQVVSKRQVAREKAKVIP